MSHYGDIMDGVPVKISEKYKRPPQIALPYGVVESPIRAQKVLDNANYCCEFEKKLLSKLDELQKAKETKRSERRHRLQLLQEAKQKKLDEIAAAEAEEKLKQLSVSDVSYPSTEEISEISPDDRIDKSCAANDGPTDVLNGSVVHADVSHIHSQSQVVNILQPIQVAANYQSSNLLEDPDPLQEYKMQSKSVKLQQYNHSLSHHNVETLTYKDFENDTSSPFDNVALKTINDMELLAEVLDNHNELNNVQNVNHAYVSPYNSNQTCATQVHSSTVSYLPNTYVDQSVQGPANMYAMPEQYQMINGCYIPNQNCDTQTMLDQNMYMQNYSQYYPQADPYVNPVYYQPMPVENVNNNMNIQPQYNISQTYFNNYDKNHRPMQYRTPYLMETQPQEYSTANPILEKGSVQSTKKSRSRSVPDIIKELDEELAQAKLRTVERSYNPSPAPKEIHITPQPSTSAPKKEVQRTRSKTDVLPNPFEKLPPNAQRICKQIESMGFPLDRIARVCTIVGDNDKRIVECLLIMGELMDLGFPERQVSAALIKNEFNRDKALDELVS